MKVLHNIISVILIIAVLTVSLFLLGLITDIINLDNANSLVSSFYSNANSKLIFGIIAGVMIILSTIALTGVIQSKGTYTVLVDKALDGNIYITVDAINDMVIRTASTIENVRDVTAFINPDKENKLTIGLHVSIRTETNIKEVIERVQSEVKTNIEQVAGLTVKNVIVQVNKTSK